ncbi:DNA-3-methyladenine glycosylase I [Marinomonas sp. M1K-6]|uniref:DNA-3-methyladenine glycosylase I n=1 Tax=Marinomonas profundi TaxID=2726122 RepID=A0A847R9U1_9GAMM|nr:DNA-3-methyladenine glycosylase I [Marinomonas profundi]NLQ17947.1 DNA-3-methyladenine glycosylase I [Marinomonas profundi]UDV01674.1 DNA-3-methyladenine glycosylase I [Marinomonas profundi]
MRHDDKPRCAWADSAPDFPHYHDTEWGFPVDNDQRLFEKLCLETFQSGLSWRTILSKRENFRLAFQQFDFNKVAQFGEKEVADLLNNGGIVRNKRKILAVINNAKRAQEMVEQEGSLAAFIWRYEPDENSLPPPETQTTSEESIALAKALKKRGWQFVGPTTIYAFMQSMGLINDHAKDCFMRKEIDQARREFMRP